MATLEPMLQPPENEPNTLKPSSLMRLMFSMSHPVTRRQYFGVGVTLMLFKYLMEILFIYLVLGKWWSISLFLMPVMSLKLEALANSEWIFVVLVLWSLPFLWIGFTMSVRRLIHAGHSPWRSLFFMIPFFNFILMINLCLLKPKQPNEINEDIDRAQAIVKSALAGLLGGVSICIALTVISVFAFKEYGATLFMGMPLFVACYAGYHFNQNGRRSTLSTIAVGVCPLYIASAVLLLFALEGVMCIVMALPIATLAGIFGALFGRVLANRVGLSISHMTLIMLCLPLMAAVESTQIRDQVNKVTSVIDIDAPPQTVWEHIVTFEALPEPQRLIFKLGIAYPMRARIEGRGVGSIRYCEFSTGPFIEPITHWDEPKHLGFSVSTNPPTMREWSLYQDVHAPHLTESFFSQRGEFRLKVLPNGLTRVEGSTWYVMKLAPNFYWQWWSDQVIHTIHLRVLEHIKSLSESAQP